VKPVFLDTSFVIALEDQDDDCHDEAQAAWSRLKIAPRRLVTTTYVFDESTTFINRHLGRIEERCNAVR
jgi:predicted nucleic acid-binding protein